MLVARFAPHERGLALVSGGQPRPLEAVGDGIYQVRDLSTRYRFVEDMPRRFERVADGGEAIVFVAQEPWSPSADELDRYAGTFFSDELQADWQIVRDGQTLVRARPARARASAGAGVPRRVHVEWPRREVRLGRRTAQRLYDRRRPRARHAVRAADPLR